MSSINFPGVTDTALSSGTSASPLFNTSMTIGTGYNPSASTFFNSPTALTSLTSPSSGSGTTPYDYSSVTGTGQSVAGSYTVQPGDTLSSIAARANVTTSALLAANPMITNANLITVGQVIMIPAGGTVPSSSTSSNIKQYISPVSTTANTVKSSSTLSTGGTSSLFSSLLQPPLLYVLLGVGALALVFAGKKRRKRRNSK